MRWKPKRTPLRASFSMYGLVLLSDFAVQVHFAVAARDQLERRGFHVSAPRGFSWMCARP